MKKGLDMCCCSIHPHYAILHMKRSCKDYGGWEDFFLIMKITLFGILLMNIALILKVLSKVCEGVGSFEL